LRGDELLDGNGADFVQKVGRTADSTVRETDDGRLPQRQVLSKEKRRGREAVVADESLNTGECVNC